MEDASKTTATWTCVKCNVPLAEAKVQVTYLGGVYVVTAAKCPSCGIVMITEEMALGKMAEAEQILEDK